MSPHLARRDARLGFLAVAASAVLFSGKAVLIKLAYRHGAEPAVIMALRMIYSLPFYLGLAALPLLRGRPALAGLGGRDLAAVAGLGFLGYYLSSVLDLLGLQYVSAAQERLILYVYPTLVVLFSAWFLGKRMGPELRLPLLLTYAGVAVSFGGEALQGGGSRPGLGSLLVFLSAVSYAVFLVLQGRVIHRFGAQRLNALAMLSSTVFVLAQFAVSHPLSHLGQPATVQALSALLAVFCTVIPSVLLGYGIARIGPSRSAVVSSVGPIATLILGAVLLAEPVGPLQVLGLALVLGGGLRLALRKTGPAQAATVPMPGAAVAAPETR